MKSKSRSRSKIETFGESFERITKIENNQFVEESLLAMWDRYNLDEELFEAGIKKLMNNIEKLKTYDDLMRFLAGIYKNDSQRVKNFKIGV